jgi:hypothetical protein
MLQKVNELLRMTLPKLNKPSPAKSLNQVGRNVVNNNAENLFKNTD